MAFTIQNLPLARLTPAPYNPRKPLTQSAHARLKKSLEAFGLVEPLVWNQRTGHVVGGHARLKILAELGYTDIPVSVVDLDDDHERALNVMLNNLEAQGRYDRERLQAILEPLADWPAFELTGFDPGVLSTLELRPADLEPLPASDTIEITLTIPKSLWDSVRPTLDSLIREHDLTSHVKE